MSGLDLLSRPVELGEIGEGTSRTVTATPDEMRAIADALNLQAIHSLTADVRLAPVGRTDYVVDGRVRAEIVQTCVVSLVPVDETVDEPFSVRFSRTARAPEEDLGTGAGIHVDLSAGEPPEPLVGSSIDLGPVIVEHLVLSIDPYPRAPGAQLPPEAAASLDPDDSSPFAALARLKRDNGNTG
jgi:uncharacterized metal-binding protein YceD (DUF177 family)